MLQAFLSMAAIVLGIALAVGWACGRLGAPSIIGYLLTGVVLSPSVFGGYVFERIEPEYVTSFGDVGLVMLLFVIGLELSPGRLFGLGRPLVLATMLQVVSTACVAAFALNVFAGLAPGTALLVGAGVALSSTAIVLKVLSDRGEIRSTLGVTSTGVLLLQDVAVIALMLFVPLLAPSAADASLLAKLGTIARGMAEIGVVVLLAHLLLPRVIRGVTTHGGHEMTALLAVLVASGGAWAAEHAGWPLEVGACMAGMLLAEADVRHQLMADITPFRDVFNALFFISLGMQVDLGVVLDHAGLLSAAVLITLVGKVVLSATAILVAGWPLRVALQLALGLCTVSEFAFVLAREANTYALLDDRALALMVPYVVGTMLLGALLVPLSGPMARRATHWLHAGAAPDDEGEFHAADGGHGPLAALQGHVIIVGYGLGGQDLARVLTSTRIPHVVIEMDPARLKRAQANGVNVLYGDAARMPILHSAGLRQARALVVAIGDSVATRHVVAQARAERKELYILARTHYVAEIDALKESGADIVIPAEFEVSIEIFSQVLKEFHVPDNILRAQIAAARAGGYSVLRGVPYDRAAHLKDLMEVFSTSATETFYVHEGTPAAHTNVGALGLRKATGVSIIAIVRAGSPSVNPMPDAEILPGDVLVLVGSHPQLDSARALLEGDISTA